MPNNSSIRNATNGSNPENNPNVKNRTQRLQMHTLSADQLNQIKKETRNMKPRYKCGDFVFLKKEVTQGGYIILKDSLCVIEQVIIRLEGTQFRERNEYKIYYFLLYEYPENFLFPELNSEEILQDEPPDGYIMFEVEENDISN